MSSTLDPGVNTDPWETPPLPPVPEQVETSQRLVARAEAQLAEPTIPVAEIDEKEVRIQQLEIEKQLLFQRNVNLRIELAQLQTVNQQLLAKIGQLQQRQNDPWWTRLWQRLNPSSPD